MCCFVWTYFYCAVFSSKKKNLQYMSLPVLFVTILSAVTCDIQTVFARFNLMMIHSFFPPWIFPLTLVSIFSISLSFSPALVQIAPPRRQSLVQRRVDPRYMVSWWSQFSLAPWELASCCFFLSFLFFLNNCSLPCVCSAWHDLLQGKGAWVLMWLLCGNLRLLETNIVE